MLRSFQLAANDIGCPPIRFARERRVPSQCSRPAPTVAESPSNSPKVNARDQELSRGVVAQSMQVALDSKPRAHRRVLMRHAAWIVWPIAQSRVQKTNASSDGAEPPNLMFVPSAMLRKQLHGGRIRESSRSW